jgi:broad specificity phosphatase PhoE
VPCFQQATACDPGGPILFVTHADVVRAIVAHYLRIELGATRRMRISHASLTALDVRESSTELVCVNYTPDSSGFR